ncbi:MAG TPA: DNRLRE domain-containing protein [Verrucomicrobiae bacterium]
MSAHAAEAELRPAADTTLFQQSPANNMGAHSHVAVGVTALGTAARGLFRFDLSSIPTNAIVQSVTITFDLATIGRPDSTGNSHAVHRMLKSWGEGTKSGNTGAAATTGEATWNHSALPTTWTSPGGASETDFTAEPSSTQNLGPAPGVYTIANTAGLVSDVQQWISNPHQNFGWIVKAVDETVTLTARRFSSRETAAAPLLRIEYNVTPVERPTFTAIDRVGANIVLRWIGGASVLESSGDLTATWEEITLGATSEFTEPLTSTNRFYRLRN